MFENPHITKGYEIVIIKGGQVGILTEMPERDLKGSLY
jgi:hypothetical protein